jgi:hypothetical protein
MQWLPPCVLNRACWVERASVCCQWLHGRATGQQGLGEVRVAAAEAAREAAREAAVAAWSQVIVCTVPGDTCDAAGSQSRPEAILRSSSCMSISSAARPDTICMSSGLLPYLWSSW